MGYIERNLASGEALAYRTGCRWIVMFWPLLGGLVLGFFGFALFAGGWMATRNGGRYEGAIVWGGLALLGAVVLIGGAMIRWLATEAGVSNRRVFIKTGLFSRKNIEVLLPKVESIGVAESLVGRILGYGTVVVRGTGGTFETFVGIARPNKLQGQVQGQIGNTRSS